MTLTPLRIVVFGNRGYASALLQNLFASGENVVGVCCKITHTSISAILKRWVRSLMHSVGWRREDSFEYRDPFANMPTPTHLAHRRGVSILDAAMIKTPDFEQQLRAIAPDVILMAGFHRLIPPNIIRVPTKAIINFHPSLLPKHRGGTPNRWIIRNGDGETGVTAHLVTEKFDEGDIILQKRIPVGQRETWGEVELRVADLVVETAKEVLREIQDGSFSKVPQDHGEATYEPPLHGKHQMIDWNFPAEEVRRICYAIRPKSGGLTTIQGKRVCIWDVEASHAPCEKPPGTIVAVEKRGGVMVCCGDGMARVKGFLSRGKIVPAHTLARRLKLRVGDCFI